ncbi:hypothetical protein FEM03_10975 [Phragmitibacter flavus]|uniref:Uncharacterized protein n=1 Tax=Phragmitibacter flavus TaxID=2576071 RepID=A0A5R8KEU9_9BACT|nr:hypothetical protein [Phragmitibacter flavus]TLD70822.1 hypothetical protein FEM03_10975 [Phragmitibacter flavus]
MSDNILEKTRCYLSGPMDFVGSRVIEKYLGWRAILTPILKGFSIRVLDPWNKPIIRGHSNYGQEGVLPNKEQYEADFWTNAQTRVQFERDFWETVHIDLRMTDLSDFVVAFVPTNVYSVGTVHEIIVARLQFKPVLLISPPVKYDFFPELAELSDEVKRALKFAGFKENPQGIPSQWYGNIVGGRNMFDGFGWEGIDIKRPDFYEVLMQQVLEDAKPAEESGADWERWVCVRNWMAEAQALKSLKGGVLDYVKFADDRERGLFEAELNEGKERERRYFWHNQPYTPKRSFLYQFLCIASGYIPPKLNILSQLNAEGQVVPVLQESVDDDWLLISTEHEN